MPTTADIIRKWLEQQGYDGLYNDEHQCGCLLDDLMPCGYTDDRCEAGYRVDYPNGDCPCGEGCDFHIESRKPEPMRNAAKEGE